MKKSTAFSLFLLGVVIGLLVSPIKNGIDYDQGNSITYNYPSRKEKDAR